MWRLAQSAAAPLVGLTVAEAAVGAGHPPLRWARRVGTPHRCFLTFGFLTACRRAKLLCQAAWVDVAGWRVVSSLLVLAHGFEDDVDQVAFEDAECSGFGVVVLFTSAFDELLRGRVVPDLGDCDAVQGCVKLPVAAGVEAVFLAVAGLDRDAGGASDVWPVGRGRWNRSIPATSPRNLAAVKLCDPRDG